MSQRFARIERYLSGAAVVASLCFVGWETRQGTIAQRAETRQSLADASREALLTGAVDVDLLSATVTYLYVDLDSALADLTREERFRVSWFLMALIRNAENVLLQHREGVIGEDALATYGFIGGFFRAPNFPVIWSGLRRWFHPDFAEAFELANQIPRVEPDPRLTLP